MMKLGISFLLFFALLSCGESDREDRGRSRDRGFATDGDRSSELNRLRGGKHVIETELDYRYEGNLYDTYTGERCDSSEECKRACVEWFPARNKSKCYRAPIEFVERVEDGFFTLLNIGDVREVDISPSLIAGMLDINVDLIEDLVAAKMNEGDVKSFLAWVAINEDIAEVFYKEDRRTKVMERAFRELGAYQSSPSGKDRREQGLNIGLIQKEDSFFYLSAVEDNEFAFRIAYKVLSAACGSKKDCKLNVFCSRLTQPRRRTRSRVLGDFYQGIECRTSAERLRRRRSYRPRRSGACYIHGAAAWSYLYELIEEGKIRDLKFGGEEDNQISVDRCNKFCGRTNSEKCQVIISE